MRKVSFYTLGCKLNFAETSSIAKIFQSQQFLVVDFEEPSDICVINTCSVTENADKECKSIVKRALQKNPNCKVIVIGCYAQLKPQEILNIQGVKLVLGTNEKFKIIDYLKYLDDEESKAFYSDIENAYHFNASFSLGERTRTFLKIQDGCDYTCSYCTIPLARGESRSDTLEGILKNVHQILEKGIKEIVLTGVNVGDVGFTEIPEQGRKKRSFTLLQLLEEVEKIDTEFRLRISSIEPNLLSDEIIELSANSRHIMPHFHIPLQSGSNTILAKMQRRYKRELYAQRVEKIKSLMPDACIGVDVIVGFPGETDELFNETLEFLKGLDVSYFHVFTYSERKNTLAEQLSDKVPMHIRKERNAILRQLSQKKQHYFYQQNIGKTRKVLWEDTEKNGMMYGWTDNYIRVSRTYNENWCGKISEVRLVGWGENGIILGEDSIASPDSMKVLNEIN
ncbi:MAG: tRNA (N(6)-L-threonylcarbamoyladenosine(37)-C(2))-methylthiotransferase MtaB [Bacteroidia bacterium]|nr:MAG: tRNA (N(6)-L-threonylcarbamoyladenosine(37)-C(2))-methylthiotransferase MtaB [Bacteroidia bacterium]